MNIVFLKNRLIRVVTRPPEILYAMSRHLFLIGFFAAVGTIVMFAVVSSQPKLYQGRARLSVSLSRADYDPNYRETSYLSPTVVVSDSVFTEAIKSLSREVSLPEEEQRTSRIDHAPEWLKPTLKELKEILGSGDSEVALSQDRRIYRAAKNLKRASSMLESPILT
ncbi:MAG: hypothetical protein AAF517_19375 [Planctomycetota bacterium]